MTPDGEKRGIREKKEGRDLLHCTTEMDDFLVRETLQVSMGTDTEEDTYSMRGRDRDKRKRKNEIWEEAWKESYSLTDEPQGAL